MALPLPTTGSFIGFANEVTGTQSTFRISSLPIADNPSKFVIWFNDQRITNPTNIVGRLGSWDGTPNGFSFFTTASSSAWSAFQGTSGYPSTNETFFLSGSRYILNFMNFGQQIGFSEYEVTQSSNTVRFISTSQYVPFQNNGAGFGLIDTASYRLASVGQQAGLAQFVSDATSSVNGSTILHGGNLSGNAYFGFKVIGLDTNLWLTAVWENNPQVAWLGNYTSSGNLLGNGPAFWFTHPNRTINATPNVNIALYLFNSASICLMEASASTTTGAQGVWLNYAQRTGSGDTFSSIGSETNIFPTGTGNAFYDCKLIPLDTSINKFAAVAYDSAGFFYRKLFLNPTLHTVTFLSGVSSASRAGVVFWDAVKLDTDSIAVAFTLSNTQSLFSVKFNDNSGNVIFSNPAVWNASAIKNVRQISFSV